ncbi:hypothetical protein Leryth_019435 [Lithospermum erythrorhizon]|nr:hypothetical protein Leryth_019435 [Lithospermum erythrorhizon]
MHKHIYSIPIEKNTNFIQTYKFNSNRKIQHCFQTNT